MCVYSGNTYCCDITNQQDSESPECSWCAPSEDNDHFAAYKYCPSAGFCGETQFTPTWNGTAVSVSASKEVDFTGVCVYNFTVPETEHSLEFNIKPFSINATYMENQVLYEGETLELSSSLNSRYVSVGK